MSEFHPAQICLNGHVINTMADNSPEFNETFCHQCGETAIVNCPNCNHYIRGAYVGSLSLHYDIPKYCYNCGSPYPWTERINLAVIELIDFTDKLSYEEKEDLKKSIDELIKGSPNTTIAQLKFKKYIGKAGIEIAKGMRDILIDVVSETVKKSIWGQ